MTDLSIIVKRKFPSGWKELAEFIKESIPLHRCEHFKSGTSCSRGRYYGEPPCHGTYAYYDNAKGLVKHTFGISDEEAEQVLFAINEIGWIERLYLCDDKKILYEI